MGRRFGQLAGLVAFALVLGRLGRLMLSGQDIPNWNLILIASAFLGGIVWWLISQTISRRGLAFTIFGLAALVLFLRISVGETLTLGVVPTDATSQALSQSLENAISQIRHGVPPIAPTQGVIAVLAVIAWAVGALYAWGATTGPAAAMVVPSIVLYLQFAIFDRDPAGLGWMIASAGMIALAVVSIGLERKRDVGRARDSEGRPKPVRTGGAAVAMAALVAIAAITGANVASGLVSEYGNVPWRSGGGFGLGPGGSDFVLQRFADLRQRLIDRSEEPLFYVSLGARAPDPGQISYRMETLDSYNGTIWDRSSRDQQLYEPDSQLGDPSNIYQGTTRTFSHTVTIDGLGGVVAPTGGVPVTIDENREGSDPINPLSFRVNTSDSSLEYPSRFRDRLSYQVTTEYPLQSSDIGALATGSDGQLSPIFQGAKIAGALDIEPTVSEAEVVEPSDLEFFRTRDESVPSGVTNLAFTIVQGAETDYERAILLEHFFRASRDQNGEPNFIYNDQVNSGIGSLDLDQWLNDSTSPNYRQGYCTQFANAMAIMAREIGLPSRFVLGFTPGNVERIGDEEVVVIRDTNAHAWVEVWIEGFGWVQFDPTPRAAFEPGATQAESVTASFDPNQFIPEDAAIASTQNPLDSGAGGFIEPEIDEAAASSTATGPRWWLAALLIIPLALSVVPLAKSRRRRRRLKQVRDGDITAAWDELVDRLQDLGHPVPPSLTPVEFARNTDSALIPVAASYSATVYGGRSGQAVESDLLGVEGWVQNRYDKVDRFKAAMNPRSLFD